MSRPPFTTMAAASAASTATRNTGIALVPPSHSECIRRRVYGFETPPRDTFPSFAQTLTIVVQHTNFERLFALSLAPIAPPRDASATS